MSYLEYFLSNGLESPHKLLNEYIKAHTTCLPGDTGDFFTSSEPELDVKVEVMGFDWERLQSGRLVILWPLIPLFDVKQIWLHFHKQRGLCNLT